MHIYIYMCDRYGDTPFTIPRPGHYQAPQELQGAARGLLGAMELCQGPSARRQVLDLSVLGHPGVGSRNSMLFWLCFFVVYANK